MFRYVRLPMAVIVLGLAIILAGCSLGSKEELPPPPPPHEIVVPTDPADFIVYYDFVDDELGAVPEGWQASIDDSLSVIVDDGLDSKRAITAHADPTRERDNHVRTVDTWGSVASGVRTIAVDYKVRLDSDSGGVNLNLSTSAGHHVNLYIDDGGQLEYRTAGLNDLPAILQKGEWHHLRIIADRESEQVWVYLDDMETPLAGPLAFRNPIGGWNNAYLLFLHGKREDVVSYGEVKVWAVD